MIERYCILCVDDNVSGLEARHRIATPQLQLAAKDSKRAADLASIRFRNGARLTLKNVLASIIDR